MTNTINNHDSSEAVNGETVSEFIVRIPSHGTTTCEMLREAIADACISSRASVKRFKKPTQPSSPLAVPIDMVLHCPKCHAQHIDAAEEFTPIGPCECNGGPDECETCAYNQQGYDDWMASNPWANPPHRSHLCHDCGHIWRPADVPTNGVRQIKTKGSADHTVLGATPAADPGPAHITHPNDDEWRYRDIAKPSSPKAKA